jgi:hypothetical protein
MNIQNKIEEKKELIYNLARDIKQQLQSPDIELDDIIIILIIIILMNYPDIKTPKDINTMLIRIFDNKNKVFEIKGLPYNVIIEPPKMSLDAYFLLMKEHLENIHKDPIIISIDSDDFIYNLSKE